MGSEESTQTVSDKGHTPWYKECTLVEAHAGDVHRGDAFGVGGEVAVMALQGLQKGPVYKVYTKANQEVRRWPHVLALECELCCFTRVLLCKFYRVPTHEHPCAPHTTHMRAQLTYTKAHMLTHTIVRMHL